MKMRNNSSIQVQSKYVFIGDGCDIWGKIFILFLFGKLFLVITLILNLNITSSTDCL